MDKKLLVVIIAIIIVAIVGIIAVPSLDEFQADYTLKEAAKLNDETLDIATNITTNSPRNLIELEDQKNQLNNMTANYNEEIQYLNDTKKYTDNQTEELYIDLLINQTQQQKRAVNQTLQIYNIVESYYDQNISAGNATLQVLNMSENITDMTVKRDDLNKKTRELIEQNPDLDDKLKSLSLDKSGKYYGKDVVLVNNSFDI